jgi:hypothetical protein
MIFFSSVQDDGRKKYMEELWKAWMYYLLCGRYGRCVQTGPALFVIIHFSADADSNSKSNLINNN